MGFECDDSLYHNLKGFFVATFTRKEGRLQTFRPVMPSPPRQGGSRFIQLFKMAFDFFSEGGNYGWVGGFMTLKQDVVYAE